MKPVQPQAVKFYCEFCGSQVKAADRICPHCGSMFSLVRCQSCGFQGESKLFLKGCPACGYSGVGQGGATKSSSINSPPQKGKKSFSYNLEDVFDNLPPAPRASAPGWAWIILAVVLVSVIVAAAFILHSVR